MRFFEDLARDLQYGMRMLRAAPLVAVAVAVTLAVGIGFDTGAFTVINGLLLRPRAESDPATFARLYADYTEHNRPANYAGQMSLSAYRLLQRESHVLAQLAAWNTSGVQVEDDGARALDMQVSCNFFSVYGLTAPKFGRLFRADECRDDSTANVAVLSEEMWQRRFSSDPHLLGKSILLNRLPFTVIGITPRDFSGRLRGPGIWVPLAAQSRLTTGRDIFQNEKTPSVWLEGRLGRGATRAELAAELSVIAPRVELPTRDLKMNILVTNGAMIEDPNIRPVAMWMMLLVISGLTLLLLVSCANVAVLLLSRAAVRRREIAVRISLGAGRRRIVRQLIAENLLLGLSAASIGLWIALQIPVAFRGMVPSSMPHYPFTLDWHITAYLTGTALLASLLAGLAPAAECLRLDVWNTLKTGSMGGYAGKGRWSVRDLLVIVQVTCSVVLMSVTAIFIRAEFTILHADHGFEARQVMQVPVKLATDRYTAGEAQVFYQRLQQRLASIPGVQAVASSSSSPLGPDSEFKDMRVQFRLPNQAQAESLGGNLRQVSANYFKVLDVPIVLGRGFSDSLGDAESAVVSQSFATAFWPKRNPIGKTILTGDGQELRVIGVARDTSTERVGEPDSPLLYRLRREAVRGDLFLLRFAGPPQPVLRAVQDNMHDLDPEVFGVPITLREALDEMADAFWALGKMIMTVALAAAALALLGIYGVVGYSVTTRTRELGVRAALGATRGGLMRLIFSSGLRPVLVGTAMGTIFAVAFAIAVAGALRQAPVPIVNSDPVPYVAVCMLLLIAALVAMLGHARRAASVQPMVALREE